MPSKMPHPNATKVFVNWILTKDVQAKLMVATKLNSRRTDVPPGAPDRVLRPGIKYLNPQSEAFAPYQKKAEAIVLPYLK
jgi:ABC-type Fe3+ transport system substrate-binding protein